MGGKEGRVFRNNYKLHMDKTNGGGIGGGGRWGWLGWGVAFEITYDLELINRNIIH